MRTGFRYGAHTCLKPIIPVCRVQSRAPFSYVPEKRCQKNDTCKTGDICSDRYRTRRGRQIVFAPRGRVGLSCRVPMGTCAQKVTVQITTEVSHHAALDQPGMPDRLYCHGTFLDFTLARESETAPCPLLITLPDALPCPSASHCFWRSMTAIFCPNMKLWGYCAMPPPPMNMRQI